MNSGHRSYPDKRPESHKDRIQNELQSLIDSPTSQGNLVKDRVQAAGTVQQKPINKQYIEVNLDGSAKKDGTVESGHNMPKKQASIFKKNPNNSDVDVGNTSSLDSPIVQVDSITQDVKQDGLITQVESIKQTESIKQVVLNTFLNKEKDVNGVVDSIKIHATNKDDPLKDCALKGICRDSGHFIKRERCKECGQAVVQERERCSGCGQILPEICKACGQPILLLDWIYHDMSGHSRSLDRKFGYGYYDKWSYDGASCRASTSRKLSRSSGDCDTDSCNSGCSCQSRGVRETNVYEKPCIIADSATLLRRSKWRVFKAYCRRRMNRKAQSKCKKKHKRKEST